MGFEGKKHRSRNKGSRNRGRLFVLRLDTWYEQGKRNSEICLPFPGQSMCFFTTARTCATNTSSHIAICTTVATLATHKMASLSMAVPISMMAMMKPVLGKTNDHQVCGHYFSLYKDDQ